MLVCIEIKKINKCKVNETNTKLCQKRNRTNINNFLPQNIMH